VVRSLAQNGPGRILPRSSDNPNESFMQYLKLSDELIDQSSKDIVAETARVLAFMVAEYPGGVRGNTGGGVSGYGLENDAQSDPADRFTAGFRPLLRGR
jgi:hypothetical protein